MSQTASATHVAEHDDHEPTEKQYWIVFAVLAVVTAIEIAWSYGPFEGRALVIPLILMMIFKFVLVAGIFMHLYFDKQVGAGWLYLGIFASAILLAVIVYAVVIATFEFEIFYFE